MKIEILLFGKLREVFGAGQIALDVDESQTVEQVARGFVSSKAEIAAVPLRFAVNDEFVDGDHRLRDGDTVALVQPVSGG